MDVNVSTDKEQIKKSTYKYQEQLIQGQNVKLKS